MVRAADIARDVPRRLVRGLLAALVTVVALSGCVRADLDARVDRNGKVSGVLIIAFSKSLLQAVGQSTSDVTAQVRNAAKDAPKGMAVTVYDVGGYVGERVTFTGLPATQFGPLVASAAQGSGALGASTARDFVLERTSKNWRFYGTIDLTNETIAAIPGVNGADVRDLQKAMRVSIKLTFPGVVTARDKNGKVNGKSISWTPQAGAKIQMQALAKLK